MDYSVEISGNELILAFDGSIAEVNWSIVRSNKTFPPSCGCGLRRRCPMFAENANMSVWKQ